MGVRPGDEMDKNVTFEECSSAIAAFERKWRNGFYKALKPLSLVKDRGGKIKCSCQFKINVRKSLQIT